MTIEMMRTTRVASPAQTAREALESLLERSQDGCFQGSLVDLAAELGLHVEAVRSAVSALDPIDHATTVDVAAVGNVERFNLTWAPVTTIVDIMIDWDLLELDIALDELGCHVEVERTVLNRALVWLAGFPGTTVDLDGVRHAVTITVQQDSPLLSAVGW